MADKTPKQLRQAAYYQAVGKAKRRELVRCELCNIEITRGAMCKHNKSATHQTNAEMMELIVAQLGQGTTPATPINMLRVMQKKPTAPTPTPPQAPQPECTTPAPPESEAQ